jgi:geranylgeranyl pyrophosphate synthase
VGEHLGVVFQVQDDLLDLVGDKGRDQKGTDIAEGKISLPAAHFLATASPAARAEGDRILRLPREETTPADIARVLALFEESGSIRYAFELISRYEAEIRQAAAAIEDAGVQTLLTGLTDVFLAPIRPHVPK